MNPLISVIIPAYNVAPYIRKSVQSVLNQTYKNLQIILIDDGATDETGKICDELALLDSRIQVVHQKNGGLSAARNTGLDIAKGDWVAFLDSDDWIEPEMYEELLKLASDYGADISTCKSRNVYADTDDKPVNTDKTEVKVFYTDDIIKDLLREKYIRFEVWNKLWRRELIANLKFKVGQVCEDVFWDRVLFMKANKIVYTSKKLHNYVVARPGNTNYSFKKARLSKFDEFDIWIDELKQKESYTLAEIIGCKATLFAMSDHMNAVRLTNDNEIKKLTKGYFNHFYGDVKNSRYLNKVAARLFLISPKFYWLFLQSRLYSLLLTIYHFVKKNG